MDMGAFFRDYGTPFALAIAGVNTIISLIIGQYFKDSPRARIALVSASIALIGLGVGASFYSTYQIESASNAERGKRSAMKDVIHNAIKEGESLILKPRTQSQDDVNAYENDFDSWSAKTALLIEDAYGKSERDIFESYAGIGLVNAINMPTVEITSKFGARMQRLNDLIRRADTIAMQPGFDPHNYHPK
jgi:hypothetical protein